MDPKLVCLLLLACYLYVMMENRIYMKDKFMLYSFLSMFTRVSSYRYEMTGVYFASVYLSYASFFTIFLRPLIFFSVAFPIIMQRSFNIYNIFKAQIDSFDSNHPRFKLYYYEFYNNYHDIYHDHIYEAAIIGCVVMVSLHWCFQKY